jgi:hypothetical protein
MKTEKLVSSANRSIFRRADSIGIWLLSAALVIFFISDMLLRLDNEGSQPIKIVSFCFLLIAIALNPRFHRKIFLIGIIFVLLIFGLERTFSESAGFEEFLRFLFPVVIAISIYAYRENIGKLINVLILVVISNDIFQCYFYFAYVTGLPTLQQPNLDSGIFLRAQGWIGFFSEYAFINFCAFVLFREFGLAEKYKTRSWMFVLFAILAFSFKLMAVMILYPFTKRKIGIRGFVGFVGIAAVVGSAFYAGFLDSFFDVAGSKIGFYITQGNSARAESYRVMFESLAGGNFLGEGLGAFGGPASVKYNSPLYAKYHFNWYGLGGILKTTDTFYPHLFVEMGLIGAITWLVFMVFYGQGSNKNPLWKFFVLVILFDNIFSMSLLSPAYIFSALIVMYAISRRDVEWSAMGLSNVRGKEGG